MSACLHASGGRETENKKPSLSISHQMTHRYLVQLQHHSFQFWFHLPVIERKKQNMINNNKYAGSCKLPKPYLFTVLLHYTTFTYSWQWDHHSARIPRIALHTHALFCILALVTRRLQTLCRALEHIQTSSRIVKPTEHRYQLCIYKTLLLLHKNF